jgi:hypothetical protein
LSIDFFEVAHIGEQFVSINEIFVNIIEIGQEHVAPENKLVEGFTFASLAQAIINREQMKKQSRTIDDMTCTEKAEEFTDSRDGRHTARSLPYISISLIKGVLQMTCKEKAASPVRKAK